MLLKKEKEIIMNYTETDWQTICNRLESARASYDTVSKLDKKARKAGDLDTLVLESWTFGEYAVNVVLEFEGLHIPTNHSQPAEARKLFAAGKLTADYSGPLQNQERFRKKAAHLGYAKNKSVKYGDADVLACLTAMATLRGEVDAAIAQRPATP